MELIPPNRDFAANVNATIREIMQRFDLPDSRSMRLVSAFRVDPSAVERFMCNFSITALPAYRDCVNGIVDIVTKTEGDVQASTVGALCEFAKHDDFWKVIYPGLWWDVPATVTEFIRPKHTQQSALKFFDLARRHHLPKFVTRSANGRAVFSQRWFDLQCAVLAVVTPGISREMLDLCASIALGFHFDKTALAPAIATFARFAKEDGPCQVLVGTFLGCNFKKTTANALSEAGNAISKAHGALAPKQSAVDRLALSIREEGALRVECADGSLSACARTLAKQSDYYRAMLTRGDMVESRLDVINADPDFPRAVHDQVLTLLHSCGEATLPADTPTVLQVFELLLKIRGLDDAAARATERCAEVLKKVKDPLLVLDRLQHVGVSDDVCRQVLEHARSRVKKECHIVSAKRSKLNPVDPSPP